MNGGGGTFEATDIMSFALEMDVSELVTFWGEIGLLEAEKYPHSTITS